MRQTLIFGAAGAALALLGGCQTVGSGYSDGGWASACQRDYQRNRAAATAAGAIIGGVAGAAVARNDVVGAAAGAVAGGLIGRELARKDDPCGYGFGGYPYDPRYGYWDDGRGQWMRR